MKALILNSGKGSRMGDLTKTHPKCMTEIASMETIISRQLRQVAEQGISEVIITTGPFEEKLIHYVESLGGIPIMKTPITFIPCIWRKNIWKIRIFCLCTEIW